MSKEDFIDTCSWMAEETAEEIRGLQIPIDKHGARIMYTVNAREPMYYPQDIAMAAKIFTVAERRLDNAQHWLGRYESGHVCRG